MRDVLSSPLIRTTYTTSTPRNVGLIVVILCRFFDSCRALIETSHWNAHETFFFELVTFTDRQTDSGVEMPFRRSRQTDNAKTITPWGDAGYKDSKVWITDKSLIHKISTWFPRPYLFHKFNYLFLWQYFHKSYGTSILRPSVTCHIILSRELTGKWHAITISHLCLGWF